MKRRLRLLSASQLKQYALCPRRWFYARILGLMDPAGEAALRGSAYHRELELWDKLGIMPSSKPALAALKYAWAPGLGASEAMARFETSRAAWIGYIDGAYDWAGKPLADCLKPEDWSKNGRPMELGSTGWTVIHDWKFTGSLRNAMSAEKLLEDSAAHIYAWEAYSGGARWVTARWVYTQMNGSAATKEVVVDLPFEHVRAGIETLDEKGAEIQAVYDSQPKEVDMRRDTSACYAFRQQCPHMERCKPHEQQSTFSFKEGLTKMSGFVDMVNSLPAIPGLPSQPPAIPGIPGLPPAIPAAPLAAVPAIPSLPTSTPPLPAAKPKYIDEKWEQHAKDLRPEPEQGFVNGPGYGVQVAASPEEAVAHQGEAVPQLAPPSTDFLESITDTDALRAIGARLGMASPAPRVRAKTIRDAIRIFCLTNKIDITSLETGVTVVVPTLPADKVVAEAAARVMQLPHVQEPNPGHKDTPAPIREASVITPWIVLDLETTGLRPNEDVILECAAIAVDPTTLEELGRFHVLVEQSLPAGIDPYVLQMHGNNGLWSELAARDSQQIMRVDASTFDALLCEWLRKYGATSRNKLSLAGNSIHFDLGFLRGARLKATEFLSHRLVDVSSMRAVVEAWRGEKLEGAADDRHRAMSDAESSLKQLRAFKKLAA